MVLRALADVGQVGEQPMADLLVKERPVAARAFAGPGPGRVISDLEAAGVVERDGDSLIARCRIDRVHGSAGELLIASDLRRHHRSPDFVVGPGPASYLLARHVRPHSRGRLLDLGTGSGIQGLLLAGRRDDVVGVDINPRAVAFTRFNARLNGRDRIRPELGDFLGDAADPRLDGRFETAVANPPFVLAPTVELLYRDRPLGGDDVGARTVERVARALTRSGRGYVLCNWIDRGGEWSDPVAAWLRAAGASGVVTRVAEFNPAAYAAVWARSLPTAERSHVVADWTAALEREGVERIHAGVIALTRVAVHRGPALRTLDRPDRAANWRPVEAALAAVVT